MSKKYKQDEMKYLVFVDIDGVLTSARAEFSDGLITLWNKFDPIAIDFFNRIHDTFQGVEFVLISTWRAWMKTDDPHNTLWVQAAFRSAGFRGNLRYPHWKVNPENDADLYFRQRAEEIKHYLTEYAEGYQDFIIFDDTDYNFNSVLGIKRFVQTDPNDGMLLKHMKNAWSIMGEWEKR